MLPAPEMLHAAGSRAYVSLGAHNGSCEWEFLVPWSSSHYLVRMPILAGAWPAAKIHLIDALMHVPSA